MFCIHHQLGVSGLVPAHLVRFRIATDRRMFQTVNSSSRIDGYVGCNRVDKHRCLIVNVYRYTIHRIAALGEFEINIGGDRLTR